MANCFMYYSFSNFLGVLQCSAVILWYACSVLQLSDGPIQLVLEQRQLAGISVHQQKNLKRSVINK